MKKLRILISNDDGIYANGINVLAKSLSRIARIEVIAPDRDRSGASNSLTLLSPLRPRVVSKNFISIAGTPTDCVHLALTGYLDYRPDFVIAGINEGANLGDDVIYSGTVAAAMEARIIGVPSIAISLVDPVDGNFATAAAVARKFLGKLTKDPLPAATILNINVPDLPLSKIRGFEVTRLGKRHSADPMVKGSDAHGRTVYWVGPPGKGEDAGPGTDFYAVQSGYVSVTPIQVDLTNYTAFDQVAKWTLGLSL